MPRCRPSQFSSENRKSIRLPRASEVNKRAPVSSLCRARVSVPRKTRLSACCAIFITRFPMPAFHCRLKYSTSASSGIVKPKRAKSRLKREARASCRSIPLRADLLGSAGWQPALPRVSPRPARAKFIPKEKVIIVGSGCAGLTAAIYAARANLSPLVLEGRQPGGQLATTTLVENYPGFPDGIDGPELILNMHRQAEKFGARFSYAEATDFDASNKNVRIKADDEWLETQALIIASGASARYLGLENEQKLIGHGLTSCATCDGAFYKNVPVCVVGGGDSAAEESLFLTRFASKVYLIHRRDKMRASAIMQERVFANKKIEPIWNTVVTEYISDEKGEMRAVRLRNVKTNEERELAVACVFVAIGHDPNSLPYRGKLDMDGEGYLITKNLVESKHPGVFVAGDVADRVYKQAVTAAGSGCAAAIDAEKYLRELEH